MRSYSDIGRATSACVHFVEAAEVDDSLVELKRDLDVRHALCSYIDCRQLADNPGSTCDVVSIAIGAEHVLYSEKGHWVKLFDDMISLSDDLLGLVIVSDHADRLFDADRSQFVNLLESFLIQLHHWLGRKKPCHLCFQMSSHPLVAQVFAAD